MCCAPCGAFGLRAGSECEAAAGWGARCVAARRGACGCCGAWRALCCGAWRALSLSLSLCVCVCDEDAQCAVCAACCALCGAVDARAVSEREATAGWGGRCFAARRGACGCAYARVMSRRHAMLRCCRRAKRTAHILLRAWCAAHCAVRSARVPEASARRRRAAGPAASRRVGALVAECAACNEQAVRNVAVRLAREADDARCVACVVRFASCGAVGARVGSECEAAAGWEGRCVAARRGVCGCVRCWALRGAVGA